MSPPGDGDAGSDSGVVLLSAECRPLRRALRPLVWVILEEVALDAVVEDGRLVARTSARQVAERLGIDPSTAADALRVLRQRGLVGLEREKGPAGRFGLSVYQLGPVAGLSVVQPCTAEPFMVSPSMVQPDMAEPAVASPCVGTPHVESPALEHPTPIGPIAGRHAADRTRLRSRRSPIPTAPMPPAGQGSPGRPGRSTAPGRAGSSSALPGAGGVRSRVGVVVTAPAVASPKGWQVSVPGLAWWGRGMVVGGVMAVGWGRGGGGDGGWWMGLGVVGGVDGDGVDEWGVFDLVGGVEHRRVLRRGGRVAGGVGGPVGREVWGCRGWWRPTSCAPWSRGSTR